MDASSAVEKDRKQIVILPRQPACLCYFCLPAYHCPSPVCVSSYICRLAVCLHFSLPVFPSASLHLYHNLSVRPPVCLPSAKKRSQHAHCVNTTVLASHSPCLRATGQLPPTHFFSLFYYNEILGVVVHFIFSFSTLNCKRRDKEFRFRLIHTIFIINVLKNGILLHFHIMILAS